MKKLYMALAVLMFACQKDIDLKPTTDYSEELFIEGILNPGKVAKIYISRALPFFQPEVTPQEVFARGAIVTLTNQGNETTLSPDSIFDYFRCRWVPFYRGNDLMQQGESYDLAVSYNNKSYFATTTIDQPKVNIDTVEYIDEFFDVYGGHDGVVIRLQDTPNVENYYRFQMNRMIDNERLHAHVLGDIQPDCSNGQMFAVTDLGRTIFNDANIDGETLSMVVEVSFEYKEGDSTWIFIQSLDKKSAQFYSSIDRQLEAIFNPFVEPVFIESQLEGALGVFGSAILSDSVLFIYPQDNP